jgi:hypothetical protein
MINFWSSAVRLPASTEFRLILFSVPTIFLLFLMLSSHHLLDQAQIIIFFPMASSTSPIAS